MPNYPRLITATDNTGLSVGNYTVESDITASDGTILDTKTINFQVIQLPPLPTAPILVSPGTDTAPGPIIDTLLPSLTWNAVSGADSYELTIFRYPYGSSNVIFDIGQLTGTSYTVPAGVFFGGEEYSWQLKASNAAGSGNSSPMFYFQSPGSYAAPAVTSDAATNVTATSATLNGNLTSLGSASGVAVSFDYGTTTNYGSNTAPQMVTATGAYNDSATGLTPDTTYHFRAQAVGSTTVYGDDLTFTTASATTTSTTTSSTTILHPRRYFIHNDDDTYYVNSCHNHINNINSDEWLLH